MFYSETGQYGRIVHLEEYRQPSPPVRDGLPILLPRALSQGSTQPVHLSFCSLCQPPRESERIGKKEIPWSPQSSSAPFVLLPAGQTQGWWQPHTKLPLAVTFASMPLDQQGTNIYASRWSLPIRRNLPPFLWVGDQQQMLCQRGYLSNHCGG